MRTQCPTCSSTYTVRAHHLREAMGYVRCPNCKAVFNALSSLTEEGGSVPEIGIQLPFIHAGDRAVIDRSYLEQTGIFSSLGELRRKEAQRLAAEQTQVMQVGGGSGVSLPDRPSGLRLRKADRERDADEETRLAAAGTGPFLAAFSSLALALRNLTRHGRRTAFGLAAIGFGVIALTLAGGFMEWLQWAERESTIKSRYGHIQIVRDDYFERGVADPYNYMLTEDDLDIEQVRRLPHVEVVTPRLSFSGLISLGETTLSFIGEGVDPETEAKVSQEVIVHAGEEMSPAAPGGIILGKGLAESLGAEVGDTVVLLTNAMGGRVSAVEARVRGIFHTAVKAYDDVTLRVPIALARELTRASGVHSWVVLLDKTEHTDLMLSMLHAQLGAESGRLEFVPWYELAEFYNKLVELFSAQMNFVRGIIGIIILMSISNTLVMSVMERTSEIGTLMALGFKRRAVRGLFLREGLLLGVLGGAIGGALGYGLAELISYFGIPMPPAPGMDHGFTAEILVTNKLLATSIGVAVVSTVLASVYPAWKASRLEIVDALRRAR